MSLFYILIFGLLVGLLNCLFITFPFISCHFAAHMNFGTMVFLGVNDIFNKAE